MDFRLTLPALVLVALPLFAEESKEAGAAATLQTAQEDTHRKIAQALIELLSETEVVLNTCQDAESVKAALPELQKLARKADDIAMRQSLITPPTVQDDMSVTDFINDFNTLWQAICNHLDRLDKAGLITPELSRVLKLEAE